MENKKAAPVTLGATDGEFLAVVGDNYRILLSGAQTDNQMAVIDMLVPPGGGPGPHAHAAIQESFYVVEGEIEVKSEAGTYTAQAGAWVTIPKGGIVHCFKNKTDKLTHLLCIVSPAGLEDFFREIGQPTKAGEFLPPPPMTPDAMEKLQALAKKHGQEVYPPDYLDK